MSNDLRWLKLDSVLIEDADLYSGAHMHPLGHAGSATGDPSGLAVASNGSVVVALGGVQEIAVGSEDDFSLQRIEVGRRPSAIAISKNAKLAFITNTFANSVSIVDLEDRRTVAEIALGPSYELSLAERGERLFFDASLSHDSWMSCNSCHPDGHTNGKLNDNFSDASFGAPKRVLSLLGRADTAPFAWNGSAKDLDTQIRNSISQTMQSDQEPKDDQVKAISAFLATLQPPPSIDRARGRQDDVAIARGKQQFKALKCISCHAPPSYTTPHTYQVNLTDKLGNDRFNPPSLLGVGQRGPYFHDNRAKKLADVFRTFGHQLDRELDGKELADLLAFLRSL
jgi:cytochrome c peroxidase